jgi:hypothetical protein
MNDRTFKIDPSKLARLTMSYQSVSNLHSNLNPSYRTLDVNEAFEYSLELQRQARSLVQFADSIHGDVLDRINEIEDEAGRQATEV